MVALIQKLILERLQLQLVVSGGFYRYILLCLAKKGLVLGIFFLANPIYGATLANAFDFTFAFLHKLLTCASKDNL